MVGVEEKRDVEVDGRRGTETKEEKAKKKRITPSFVETRPFCPLLCLGSLLLPDPCLHLLPMSCAA